jgi:hypothetical protein
VSVKNFQLKTHKKIGSANMQRDRLLRWPSFKSYTSLVNMFLQRNLTWHVKRGDTHFSKHDCAVNFLCKIKRKCIQNDKAERGCWVKETWESFISESSCLATPNEKNCGWNFFWSWLSSEFSSLVIDWNQNTEIWNNSVPIPKPTPKDGAYRNQNRNCFSF